ncbi:MAG: hypothetical protein ACR2PO_12385 [Methyloligellaceae bacterium]
MRGVASFIGLDRLAQMANPVAGQETKLYWGGMHLHTPSSPYANLMQDRSADPDTS